MKLDILIVGGGLSGASLACALRGSRFRVGLIERAAPVRLPDWDARIYAISPANVTFLERCGVWGLLDQSRIEAVEAMQVFGDAGGQMRFSAYECGLDALAWIAEASRMAVELWETARRQSNIEVLCPAQPDKIEWLDEGAALTLADGRRIEAKLIVAADGVHSWVREQAGITAEIEPYGELGVVANFLCEKPHHGTAFQWFREDGILAYLPLPGNQVSIVWSTPEPHGRALMSLSAEDLVQRVADAGQRQLGTLQVVTSPAAFPLRRMKVLDVVAPRLALIGDAAHAIHPLSGHGINLGFQDARALADMLLALPSWRDCGELPVLRGYARSRAEEVTLVRTMTHGLNRLFATPVAPLSILRNLGLSATGRIPVLRSALARYAAGLF
jgi:2-polyprenylphenol 6-hydroxylase